MSFHPIDPDLARLLLARRKPPRAAEVARSSPDAPDQRLVTALVLACGGLSILSAVVPWP